MRLCSGAQARSIASKPGDGAAVVDVVAVGLGQIPAYVAPKSGGVDRSRRAVKALRHPAREAEIAEYLDPWTDPRVTRSWLALAGAAENRYTQEMLPALLQSRTPKLLLWDEDGPISDGRQCRRLRAGDRGNQACPDQVGAGHIPMENDPKALAGALAEFFAVER